MIKKISWIRDDTVRLGLCRPININDMKSFWTCFEAESHCVKCRVACSVWSSSWLTSDSPQAWLPVRFLVSPTAESGCLFSRVSLPLTWSGTVSWSVLSRDTLMCAVQLNAWAVTFQSINPDIKRFSVSVSTSPSLMLSSRYTYHSLARANVHEYHF